MTALLLACAGFAMVLCGTAATLGGRPRAALRLFAAGNGTIGLIALVARWWWPVGAANLAVAIVAAWMLWRWRDRRRRAPRAYGAKSWARITALTRKARETSRPRPAGRPAPQGG